MIKSQYAPPDSVKSPVKLADGLAPLQTAQLQIVNTQRKNWILWQQNRFLSNLIMTSTH